MVPVKKAEDSRSFSEFSGGLLHNLDFTITTEYRVCQAAGAFFRKNVSFREKNAPHSPFFPTFFSLFPGFHLIF
jgi:hypothetical protein